MTGYICKDFRHECADKGCYIKQLPSWDDLIECFPGKIKPTDIDGMVEINGNFLFLEEKSAGATVSDAQGLALRLLAMTADVTVAVFRPGKTSDLEVLIYDGFPPYNGYQPYSRQQFKNWLHAWAEAASRGVA
jgi:hypothetical protein